MFRIASLLAFVRDNPRVMPQSVTAPSISFGRLVFRGDGMTSWNESMVLTLCHWYCTWLVLFGEHCEKTASFIAIETNIIIIQINCTALKPISLLSRSTVQHWNQYHYYPDQLYRNETNIIIIQINWTALKPISLLSRSTVQHWNQYHYYPDQLYSIETNIIIIQINCTALKPIVLLSRSTVQHWNQYHYYPDLLYSTAEYAVLLLYIILYRAQISGRQTQGLTQGLHPSYKTNSGVNLGLNPGFGVLRCGPR
jgi:hypothetical protein